MAKNLESWCWLNGFNRKNLQFNIPTSSYSGLILDELKTKAKGDKHQNFVKYKELWKEVIIGDDKLTIWGEVVVTWSDDRTKKCDVSLSLD